MKNRCSGEITLISVRFGRDRGRMPPLGALYLGGSLDRACVNWNLIDTQKDPSIHPFALDAFVELLNNTPTEYIGLSIFNDALPLVVAALEKLGGNTRSKIVLGGPGVVGVAHRLIERLPTLYAVVVGEGETALTAIVSGHFKAPMTGVFMRGCAGEIVGQGQTPREDLNALASPAWSWCRGRQYKTVPLSTMRGCPFKCSFCEITPFMGRRVTRTNTGKSIAELRDAMDLIGSDDVSIVDDTFTLGGQVLDFCEKLALSGLSPRFSIFSRIDTLKEPQMVALAKAGCKRIFFGIDFGDNSILSRISKGFDIGNALDVLKRAAEYYPITASFVWGYPFETLDAFSRTLDCCFKLLELRSAFPITPQLHSLSPCAATAIYKQHHDELILDYAATSLLTPGGLLSWSHIDGYEEVLNVIRGDILLGASFYRYQTPAFQEKHEMATQFGNSLLSTVGKRIIHAMQSEMGYLQ